MPVRWRQIPVPFRGGVDTKSDDKALPPTKLAVLENGIFTKRGAIVKRNGYSLLGNRTEAVSPATISSANKLAVRDDELLLIDDSKIYSYAEATDNWVDKGEFESPTISLETVAKMTTEQTLSDSCSSGNLRLVTWSDSRGTVRYTCWNEQTGAVYANDTALESGSSNPRCITCNGLFYLIYAVTGSTAIKVLKISPSNVSNSFASSTVSLGADLNATEAFFDVCKVDDSTCLLAYINTSDTVTVGFLPETSANNLANETTVGAGSNVADTCVACAWEPNTRRAFVGWNETGTLGGVWGTVLDSALVAIYDESRLVTTANLTNVTAAFEGEASDITDNSYSIEFDGVNQSVTSATNVPDLAGTDDWGIEGWIYVDAYGSVATYIMTRTSGAGGNPQYHVEYNNAGTLTLATRRSGGAGLSSWQWTNYNLAIGEWTHLSFTVNMSAVDEDAQALMYVNGVSYGYGDGDTLCTQVDTSAGPVSLGGSALGGNSVNGKMDGWRIWKGVLRSAEVIAANMHRQVQSTPRGGLAAWEFNNDLTDEIGQCTLTGVNSPTFSTDVPFTSVGDDVNYKCHIFSSHGTTWDLAAWHRSVSTRMDVSSASNLNRHGGVASRAFAYNNDVYVWLAYASALQSTYFLVKDDGTVRGKALYATAGGHPAVAMLPQVENPSGNVYVWSGHYKKRLDTTPSASVSDQLLDTENEVYTELGTKLITMDWTNAQARRGVQVGDSTYFAGSYLQQYDSQGMTEAGFHLFPEGVTAAGSNPGTGSMAEGSYSYRVYYEWTNARGERERSSGLIVTESVESGEDTITLTIPNLTYTAKQSPRTDVSIAVYRTTVDPTINAAFYRVSSLDPTTDGNDNGYLSNDTTSVTSTFVDELVDTDITSKELDYQNTGELDNIAPPPSSIIAQGKDRLFLAGFEDESVVRYSKLYYTGDVVAFHDGLSFRVDQEGGPITALAVMNEALVIFKRRRIYAVTGDGPNNFGGGGFSLPQLITSDTGCKDQRTVAMTPIGLMFFSDKGIQLLDQQFRLHYVGADVEGFNAQTYVSADLVADDDQVRFLTSSGESALFDYEHQQWSTFTNHIGVDAQIWKNEYVYVRSNGRVYRESPTLYTDGGQPYRLKLQTGWYRLSGLQGFQRVRRIHLLGEFHSTHELLVDIEYDYVISGAKHRATFDASTVIGSSKYGDGATYGADDPYGDSAEPVYQFRVRMPRQKCQSVRFTIQDKPGSDIGQSYEITELALEAGLKGGGFRLPSGKTVTTT